MSLSTTIARPYAKAIFEHALKQDHLVLWSDYLSLLSQAVSTVEAAQFIMNPAVTREQQIELLLAVFNNAKDKEAVSSLIRLLAANKRFMILPEIRRLYEVHKAEQEKTLDVTVLSYSELSKEQQKQLITSLSQRLKRSVSLKISIDPSLLGGALIQAGDLVIDGSVRGKLNKLATELAA